MHAFFDCDPTEIIALCEGKKFRYLQIIDWICKKGVVDFREMTNLAHDLRTRLHDHYTVIPFSVEDILTSSDTTTQKILFRTHDGLPVETVSMQYEDRHTLCVSVQSGCKMACSFCATASLGFKRSLTIAEIFGQLLYFKNVTNIVFMGMGEPFDTTETLFPVLDLINDEKYYDFGARRVTISTIGIPTGIRALADTARQFGISWSLHAPNQELRTRLMPVAAQYPIEEIIDSLLYYRKKTNADLTIEYILIRNENMDSIHASGLLKIARRLRAKINLIPYNPHPGASYEPPNAREIHYFASLLAEGGGTYFIRDSKGADIQAGCGQLAGKRKE